MDWSNDAGFIGNELEFSLKNKANNARLIGNLS